MNILTLDELLALPDAAKVTEPVDLSAFGWQRGVAIRQFSVAEQRAIRAEARGEGDEVDQHRLDVLTLQRGIAEPALTVEQAEALLRKQYGAVQHILNHIHRLSGLTTLMEVSAAAADDAERRFRKRRG